MTHELKQLACIVRHKRHLVYRCGPQESDHCIWCGLYWYSKHEGIRHGDVVRVYLGGENLDDTWRAIIVDRADGTVESYKLEQLSELVKFG